MTADQPTTAVHICALLMLAGHWFSNRRNRHPRMARRTRVRLRSFFFSSPSIAHRIW